MKSLLKPHPKKSTKGGLKSSVLLGQWLTYRTQRERPLGQGFIYVTTWKERLLEKKRKSLKERGGLSSGWSLIRVVSHQGGLSSGWSLNKVVSHQGGLSRRCSLIRVVSHQVVSQQSGLSTRWSLIRVVSQEGGLSSGCSQQGGLSSVWYLLGWSLSGWSFTRLVRVVFHQGGLSSGWSLGRVVSRQGGLPSGWTLNKVVFHQGGLSTGWSFNKIVSHQGHLLLGVQLYSNQLHPTQPPPTHVPTPFPHPHSHSSAWSWATPRCCSKCGSHQRRSDSWLSAAGEAAGGRWLARCAPCWSWPSVRSSGMRSWPSPLRTQIKQSVCHADQGLQHVHQVCIVDWVF